ncbi:putative protein YcbX [Myxococcaceae bacterium]|nr:putative protein YcbX [Myxococcaceae bacterium]
MPGLRVASLHLYPVKSCRGLSPARWRLGPFGLEHDRSFMVVDETGRFLTQREHPALAQVETRIEADALVLAAPGEKALEIPLAPPVSAPRVEIVVWKHSGPALDRGEEAAAVFSRLLGIACRLVSLPADHGRRVDPARFAGEAHTSFTDGYPILVLSEASVADLNRRLAAPVPIDRFRPGIVVAGCEPFAEDGWKRIRVGEVEIEIVKPCSRCAITTTDQRTGTRDGKEPLRTLARYRQRDGQVWFAQNAVHLSGGVLEVGAPIEVLATQPPFLEVQDG